MKVNLKNFFCAYFHVREISETSTLDFRVYAVMLV
jgi:hypothetical protein